MFRSLLPLTVLVACGGGEPAPADDGAGPPSLTLLLTGDVGGLLEPCG